MSNKSYVLVVHDNVEDSLHLHDDKFFNIKNLVETAKTEHTKSSNKELFEVIELNKNIHVTIIEGDISPAVKTFIHHQNPWFQEHVWIYREEDKEGDQEDA